MVQSTKYHLLAFRSPWEIQIHRFQQNQAPELASYFLSKQDLTQYPNAGNDTISTIWFSALEASNIGEGQFSVGLSYSDTINKVWA